MGDWTWANKYYLRNVYSDALRTHVCGWWMNKKEQTASMWRHIHWIVCYVCVFCQRAGSQNPFTKNSNQKKSIKCHAPHWVTAAAAAMVHCFFYYAIAAFAAFFGTISFSCQLPHLNLDKSDHTPKVMKQMKYT